MLNKIFLYFLLILLLIIGFFGVLDGGYYLFKYFNLKTNGITLEAEVINKTIEDNDSYTDYFVHYSFLRDGKAFSGNDLVDYSVYKNLNEGDKIEVYFLKNGEYILNNFYWKDKVYYVLIGLLILFFVCPYLYKILFPKYINSENKYVIKKENEILILPNKKLARMIFFDGWFLGIISAGIFFLAIENIYILIFFELCSLFFILGSLFFIKYAFFDIYLLKITKDGIYDNTSLIKHNDIILWKDIYSIDFGQFIFINLLDEEAYIKSTNSLLKRFAFYLNKKIYNYPPIIINTILFPKNLNNNGVKKLFNDISGKSF